MNKNQTSKALGLRLKSLVLFAVVAVTAVLGARPVAHAANTQDTVTQYFGALSASKTQLGAANSTVMVLSYTGPEATASVTIGASSITFYAPNGTGDTTIGSSIYGGSGGSFDLTVSSVSTLGELCDLINGTQGPFVPSNSSPRGGAPSGGYYHCTLTGGIRDDATQSAGILPNVAAQSLTAAGGYAVPFATTTIMSIGIIPTTGRRVVLNWCSANANGTPTVNVYGSLAINGVGANGYDTFGNATGDSTLVWTSAPLVDDTTRVEPLATATGFPWLEFGGGSAAQYNYWTGSGRGGVNVPVGNAYNGHVVVRISNFAVPGPSHALGNFLSCGFSER